MKILNLYFHTHKFSALGKIQYIDKYAELPALPSVMNTSPFPLIHIAT
jgi:hypothetical protein